MNLPSRKTRLVALAAVLVFTAAIVPSGSQAVITSNFNTQDGDLIGAAGTDWSSVDEQRQEDAETGSSDDSFGQGTKEDTAVPTIVQGGIPNNKSDLLNFGVYFEDSAQGRYLHMFWQRVQEPTGTTNMDFEFNQSSVLSANGVTPRRTAGDLLIQYDLAQGGVTPELFVSEWVTAGSTSQCEAANKLPCWGDRVPLGNDAVGSINTSAIAAGDSDGLGAMSPRTFGEATVDFDAVVPGASDCEAFAFAYLKSRSSDSFTAAAKDFIAPLNPGINSCGAIKITKTFKHAANNPATGPHAGVTFRLRLDGAVIDSGVTNSNGKVCFDGLAFDDYVVREVAVDGYATNADQNVTVDNAASCGDDPYVGETASFVNTPLTDITVTVDSQVDGGTASTIDCHPAAGVDLTIPATDPENGDGSYAMSDL